MQIYFVHHAEALSASVDTQQPLSSAGLAQADAVAAAIAARGFVPMAIWHSGKLRARQTAQACWRACAPLAEFKMVRGLGPGDPPELMRNTILSETRDVLIVGHMPNLPGIVQLLTGELMSFPRHGAVAVESQDLGATWREIARI